MKDQALLDAFGRRIRHLRTAQGLSQEQLADPAATLLLPEEEWHRPHTSGTRWWERTYIGMIERGERNISLSNIGVFAMVFKLTVAELFDFERGES